ncbi:MAG: hypothetical protein HY754_10105 [Nitrospirae bacterium]|nr:hypothetical protein [Nitrospirota bacterium]
MIKLRLWQALIILFFMCLVFIKVIGYIYKQADAVAVSRVNSEIITGVKEGTPFYIKGSNIKLIPKGKKEAGIMVASKEEK